MNTNYFYTPPHNINDTILTLTEEEFHHCFNVLRTNIGEKIFVVDGGGNCYEAELFAKHADFAEAKIIATHTHFHEPTLSLTLAIGLLKNHAKFDFIVEKATELGVKKIIPVITAHTIAHQSKNARWEKLALAAMKQCGRSFLPEISPPHSFDELIATQKNYHHKLIAYEYEPPGAEIKISQSALVLIGSEGGFSSAEIEKGKRNGWQLISLGERRLRTETAAIAVCAKFIDG